jgi:IS605 OrfB family transposase
MSFQYIILRKEGKKMYACQQNLISKQEILPFFEYLCTEANNLTNCGLYLARQLFFKTKYIVGKYDLEKLLKQNLHFQFLYSQAAQQILRSVAESFASFKALNKLFFQGKLDKKPKLPNYRKSGGLALITYPKQALKLVNNQIRIPLGKKVKASFRLDCFYIPIPTNLTFNSIKELRILPRNGYFDVEFVYQKPDVETNLDKSNVLGIDHGLDNWLSCVSSLGKSFIIDGQKVKSNNQWYNKQVGKLKTNKPQGFWSEELANITEKRNRQMRDNINKTARFLINWCLKNNVGTIIFGWNKGQKNGINIGAKNNQKFVQVPTAKLKTRIAQLCAEYGIEFRETEESYTSKSSFLDNDELPKYGEKPVQEFSGKRVKRGLYKIQNGFLINADLNGAANMIRKANQNVNTQTSFDLSEVCREVLSLPHRYDIFKDLRKSYRKAASKNATPLNKGGRGDSRFLTSA